jgi:hypothetical protein
MRDRPVPVGQVSTAPVVGRVVVICAPACGALWAANAVIAGLSCWVTESDAWAKRRGRHAYRRRRRWLVVALFAVEAALAGWGVYLVVTGR